MSNDTLELMDWVCHLPMRGMNLAIWILSSNSLLIGGKKSLNVGVAFGMFCTLF